MEERDKATNSAMSSSDISRHLAEGAILLLPFLGLFMYAAAARPLWYDELITELIVQRGSLGGIFAALKGGGDIHPPLDYVLRYCSTTFLGPGEWAFRLPSSIAIYLGTVLFFASLRTVLPLSLSLAGSFLVLASHGFHFAIEARCYSLMILGVAWLLFEFCRQNRERNVWHLLRTFSACFILCAAHFYGVIAAAVMIGTQGAYELARRRNSLRPLVAASMGAVLGCATYLPFLLAARSTATNFWTEVSFAAFLRLYSDLFGGSLAIIITIIAVGILLTQASRPRSSSEAPIKEQVGNEILLLQCLALLVLLPVSSYIVARLGTGAFLWRYVIGAILGFAGIVSYFCGSLANKQRMFAPVVLFLATTHLVSTVREEASLAIQSRHEISQATQEIAFLRKGSVEPIVIGDRYLFFALRKYAPSLPIFYMLLPRSGETRPQSELAIEAVRTWIGNVMQYEDAPKSFLLMGLYRSELPKQLAARQASLEVRLGDSSRPLYYYVRRQ